MMADRQAQPQTPEQQIDWWAQVVEHVAKASRVAQSRDPERIRVLCRGRFDLTTHQVRRALKDAGDRAEPGVKYDPETGQPYI
ncbi:MAG TPA: hypothetical protein VF329_03460 [Gammaproteobacteria bacterium]